MLHLVLKSTTRLRAIIKIQPLEFKHKSNITKAKSKAFRNWLFQTDYLKTQANQLIQKGIIEYNSKEFTKGITRQEAEYFNTKLESKSPDTMTLVNSNDIRANAVRNINISDIKEVQNQLQIIFNSNQNINNKYQRIDNLIIPSIYLMSC